MSTANTAAVSSSRSDAPLDREPYRITAKDRVIYVLISAILVGMNAAGIWGAVHLGGNAAIGIGFGIAGLNMATGLIMMYRWYDFSLLDPDETPFDKGKTLGGIAIFAPLIPLIMCRRDFSNFGFA